MSFHQRVIKTLSRIKIPYLDRVIGIFVKINDLHLFTTTKVFTDMEKNTTWTEGLLVSS